MKWIRELKAAGAGYGQVDGVEILGEYEDDKGARQFVLAGTRQHPDDAQAATMQHVTEDMKQTHAAVKELVKELKPLCEDGSIEKLMKAGEQGEKVLELSKAVADLERAVKRAPLVIPNEKLNPLGLSFDALMQRRSNVKEIIDTQRLVNRSVYRGIVKAMRSGYRNQLRVYQDDETGAQALDISSIPDECFFKGNPEWEEANRVRKFAAGSWWDTTTTQGAVEWRPAGIARMAVDFYFIDTLFLEAFEQQVIPMGVGPFSIPIETGRGQAVLEAEETAVSATLVKTALFKQELTGVITFVPNTITRASGITMNAIEDLAVDGLERLQMNCAKAVRRGLRQCVINGQTTDDATLDGDEGTSLLETANGWVGTAGDGNGLRLHAIENSYVTSVGGALTVAAIFGARKAMREFGNDPAEVITITSALGHISLLDDVRVVTMDLLGPNATVLRGQLASVGGSPLFADGEFPDDMAAGGVAAGTGALSGAIVVNRTRFWIATKRELEVIIDPQVGIDSVHVYARMRADSRIAVAGTAGAGEHSLHYLTDIS